MLLLEINEFSHQLLSQSVLELDVPNIGKLLSMAHSKTTTDDERERFGLDPWVQWVSIHTGLQSSTHQVKHLGDIPMLAHEQIWEKLDKKGIHTGIWGAMNASKGTTINCDFFFPDPWCFSESAFPKELNNLLSLPRYYSQNYGDLSGRRLLIEFAKLVKFFVIPSNLVIILPIVPIFFRYIIKYGAPNYLLFLLFDLVNAVIFTKYYRKSKPTFVILFLNSIAHLQHHKWTGNDSLSDEMKVSFEIFNKILGIIFDNFSNKDVIIVANAFSQYCSYSQNEYLYRQKNPRKFLESAGIVFLDVEQAMTNDGHVFFANYGDAQVAAEILSSATVNGHQLFMVDIDPLNPNNIFFQVVFWNELDNSAIVNINSKEIPFFDLFHTIVRRSGSHVQDGDIFSQNISFPKKVYNHEIFGYIYDHFEKNI